jgi:UDP-glucose 6-dehydrogenase
LQAAKKGERVGILGLSYKAGTSVKDESPGVLIARGLSGLGFEILAWDQEISAEGINEIDKHYKLCETSSEVIRDADFVVISRVLADNSIVKKQLLNSHKPFYDIWRQF